MSEMPAAARPVRRRVITEEISEEPPRATAYVCEAASCMSAQSHDITIRLGERAAELGLGDRPAALIEALHAAQEAFGYLDDDALNFVGDTLGVPHSRVYGVATFYSFFTLKPQGEHTCVVCTGTACYINGAKEILARLDASLGVKPKETTADGKVSLLTARCIGACSLAPAVIVDGEAKGKVVANELVAQLEAM